MPTTTDFGRTVTLSDQDDIYAVPGGNNLVATIYGLAGDDDILGGSAAGTIYGGDGNDTLRSGNLETVLVGGLGANTYYGSIAALNGNIPDYTFYDAGTAGQFLYARNGSGDQRLFVQTVVFQDGTTVGYRQLAQQVAFAGAASGSVQTAPISGGGRFDGGIGTGDILRLNGNIDDYTLSRESRYGYKYTIVTEGDFLLTAINGSGNIDVGQKIDTIYFNNGQYLSLLDLPSYIKGSAAIPFGGSEDDLLLQTRAAGYELFIGGYGNDTVYLKGNLADYVITSAQAYSTAINNSYASPGPAGVVLTAVNGSGELVIDLTVETIRFQNGDSRSFSDLLQQATSGPENLYLVPDGVNFHSLVQSVPGTAAADRLLLNGDVGDYSLSRASNGDFVLTAISRNDLGPGPIEIGQEVETVQFANGQYLSLYDLPSYVHGDPTYTVGFVFDDLLFPAATGDQYIVGNDGNDIVYLKANVGDYKLRDADLPNSSTHLAIHGYELIARDGSGTIAIDDSTETVHFQNGQYLSFGDLSAYITAV